VRAIVSRFAPGNNRLLHASTLRNLLFGNIMDRWITIERTTIPGSDTELTLSQRGDDFAMRIAGQPGDLMNSRRHHSEDMLAELGCAHISATENAKILVGGLGMGFTLAAVLKTVAASAEVIVAELVPAVVEWNRGALGQCAGQPTEDQRTRIYTGDVADQITQRPAAFDAILLDVDNGPDPITHADNEWLYSIPGLQHLYEAVRPQGIVAIWSAGADDDFLKRLKKTGFSVEVRTVRARPGKGSRHKLFLARKPG
jgi:spermidine synthase